MSIEALKNRYSEIKRRLAQASRNGSTAPIEAELMSEEHAISIEAKALGVTMQEICEMSRIADAEKLH